MFDRLFASHQRPCFKKPAQWDTLSIDLSGSRFEITLPPQDYDFPEDPRSDQINLFDEKLYDYSTEPDRNGYPPSLEGVSRSGLFRRNWFSYGPIWQPDHIGTLQCAAVICDTSRMTPELNCFNPAHLEKLILHGLYYSYGPGFSLNEHTTPVNWKILSIKDTNWVYLESWSRKAAWIRDNDEYRDANFSVRLITPLFSDKYLLVSFSATGSLPAEVSNQLMLQRIEGIVASLKLQLSPEATRQKAQSEQTYPDSRYSAHREPEPWQYYSSYRNGDILEGEEELVIEGPCSPPPSLD